MQKFIKALVLVVVLFNLAACSYANLDDVKAKAPAKWNEVGFSIVGYEGYQWGNWIGGSYGGAKVWYQLRKNPDNGISYTGFLQKWGDEYHVYDLRALDALKPN